MKAMGTPEGLACRFKPAQPLSSGGYGYLQRQLRAVVRDAAKGALAAFKTAAKRRRWLSSRRSQIGQYFDRHSVRKLHLGCGPVLLDGWLNADWRPRTAAHVFVDVTEVLPFPDQSFDYILTEHLIGDLSYAQLGLMLDECYRVLRPRGRLRISTPNLAKLAELYSPRRSPQHDEYVRWTIDHFALWADAELPGLVINNLFHEHPLVYDPATLEHALRRTGFEDVWIYQYGLSDDPALNGVDSHGAVLGRTDISAFESVVLEGVRP
jgi:SAM-dependent methyltransferase